MAGPKRENRGSGVFEAASTTVELLARARNGDQSALDQVFAREIPRLTRWARARLPQWARSGLDTDDLVQDTVVQTLKRINVFEYRADAALQAYLRQAVMNRIRNEIRREHRHPAPRALDDNAKAADLSSLEALIDRVELDLGYAELAKVLDRPSPDAARMAVGRALVKLAKLMDTDAR